MLRSTLTLAGNTFRRIVDLQPPISKISSNCLHNFSALNLWKPQLSTFSSLINNQFTDSFLQPVSKCSVESQRSLTKFSLQSGKRKTVKAVLKRFYRLDWGIWIHGKCGRNKKLYKKSASRKRRLRQHVFTNATQSWLLDSMVTRYWRKPKYYVDDPYEPYHKREEFAYTRRKPQLLWKIVVKAYKYLFTLMSSKTVFIYSKCLDTFSFKYSSKKMNELSTITSWTIIRILCGLSLRWLYLCTYVIYYLKQF